MRTTLMLAVLVTVTSSGCTGPFPPVSKEQQARIDEANDRIIAARETSDYERELKTGKFPTVTVGMSYTDLKQQIAESNPPYEYGGREIKNVWVGGVAQYLDTATITYRVRRGPEREPATVMVTVQGDTVVGFSR